MIQPATPPATTTKSAPATSGSVFDPLVTKLAAARAPHTAAQQALANARQAWADALVAWKINPPPPMSRQQLLQASKRVVPAEDTVVLPDLTTLGKALVAAIEAEESMGKAVSTAQGAVNAAMKAAGAV